MHFFLAIMIMCFALLFFYIMGDIVITKLGVDVTNAMKPVLGCFVFFAIITPAYLVCAIMRYSIIILGICITLVMCFGFVAFFRMRKLMVCIEMVKKGIKENLPCYVVLIPLTIIIAYHVVRSGYIGADTSAYIISIRDAAYHNTLYEYYDPENLGEAYALKYFLCSYYMVLAFLVKVTNLPVIIVARAVGGGCCVILAILVVYTFAVEVFAEKYSPVLTTTLWIILNFFDMSVYTSSAFLMDRAYEGKAWCANIILPFILMLFYHLFRKPSDQKWWIFVFVVCISCNTISMSGLLSVPAILTICSILIFVKIRKAYVIKYWLICILPLAVYGIAIFLESKSILKVMA